MRSPGLAILLLVTGMALAATGMAAELRDPTRPGGADPVADSSEPSAAIRVSAVFISGERRVAVINGQRLRIGDTIAGATVRSIDRNSVGFARGDTTFSVALLGSATRQ
ncbi:MAG: general secretion pathway protein GspB [Woeseiaceae bacterium]|nr:general secretion pathway protein GspB [Woeseiaceae bacterium]